LLYKPVCAQTPVITKVTDRSGSNIISAAPGTLLLIHGNNFGSGLGGIQGWNYVCFCTTDNDRFINDYPLSNSRTRGGGFTSQNNRFQITSWSDELITLIVPDPSIVPSGPYAITVFLWDGKITDEVSAQSNGVSFRILAPVAVKQGKHSKAKAE
jgi:hypothetical protein